RLHTEVGARLVEERRVDAARLDERDRYGRTLLLQLHAQRLRERLDRVLGRAVVALERDGAIRQRARDVDERAALLSQVRYRRPAAVHPPPVQDVELPAHVLER